ncbi:MAG: ferritin [Deltaproteobacteria bacterium]|nr:ferritin [Deltaproteobacteria bacterium]
MLNENVQNALNAQFNAEMYSSYLYLSMNGWFKSISLDGFANWMYQQAKEELVHAMKFYEFINQRGGRFIPAAIDTPPHEWDSPLAVFEDTLAHEQKVTAMIDDLVEIADNERDHATHIFLQWFVTEQVEEEENASGVLEQLRLVKDDKSGLFMIDRELMKRPAPSELGAGE